ncbi:MAG: tRNA preQ1(34) S-adenosylmethionine ribosyltransferase-isomerase QueA [bacterium]
MELSAFDFSLPSRLIAQKPAPVRDRSRLMIVDRATGDITECEFRDIVAFLCPDDLMVLNDTRVFPARLCGIKEDTGGRVEVLLVHPVNKGRWHCMVRGRIRAGQRLVFAGGAIAGEVVEKQGDGTCTLQFLVEGDLFEVLQKHGQIPLPPYIKREHPLPEDRARYQTVFARHWGAVAAPTAGLHFTGELLERIRGMGIEIAAVTLHVGPGTFRPIREEAIERHIMESEAYRIRPEDHAMIVSAKEAGRRIVAVGTTTTRVLETIYLKGTPSLAPLEGWADLFITPGFRFNAVDALVTNFHLPRSTLLILVCAFGGYDLIMSAYRRAVEKGYRFYSYGDAMLIR